MLSSKLIKTNKPGSGTKIRNQEKTYAWWGLLHNTTISSSRLCHCGRSHSQPPSSKSQEAILISAPFFAEGKVVLLVVVVVGRWGWGLWHTIHRTTSTYFPLIKKEFQAANQPATSPDLLCCRGCCCWEVWKRGLTARRHDVVSHR